MATAIAKPMPALSPVSNDAESTIILEVPYIARFTVEGTSPILFHRWSCESVEEKANAPKGSKAKKTDDVESYVYRMDGGIIAIPGEYFRQSLIHAARYQQDPRSPRKSAMDLFKAGIAVMSEYCSLGTDIWAYIDQRRVTVQRQGVTRHRPAFHTGWRVEVELQVLTPEYIAPRLINDTMQKAGKLIGIGDNRPSYGRFSVVHFEHSLAI